MNSFPEGFAWAIFLLPVASSVLITLALLTGALPRRQLRLAGYLTILCIFVAFLLSLWALKAVDHNAGHPLSYTSHQWLQFPGFTFTLGLRVDGLTAVMLVVVTSVSLLVQYYSQGYMEGDPGYGRYYAYMSLFTASMLGLVLSDSILFLFVNWELVGLCSFLLIGFWFHKPSAAAAAKKAFITTRVGDVGFMIAILIIWTHTGTFDIARIHQAAVAGTIGSTTLTLFALGVFAGAAGKSAQVPLHIWLPDAMEGPTPVSALIHAATMVAAGVYLVARFFPVFAASSGALHTVAWIGAITAIVAATMGVVNPDIKRVLAYSTISQLGYMMLGLGSGAYVAAIFHLMNHAFFKALLFLGSGSVNRATNTFDMRLMGGLRRAMPITFWTFVIASLSLAGVPPFSGFYSKDDILHAAWNDNKILFVLGFLVVFLTAFYMARVIFLTFFGEFRGGAPHHDHWTEGWTTIPVSASEDQNVHDSAAVSEVLQAEEEHEREGDVHRDHAVHPHESPWVMLLPLVVLAVPAVISWLVNYHTHWFGDLIKNALPAGTPERTDEVVNWGLAIASIAMALAGIFVGYVIYQARRGLDVTMGRLLRPLYVLFSNKWYADVIGEDLIARGLVYRGLAYASDLIDTYVIDGIANGFGLVTERGGAVLRRAASGEFQAYGFIFSAGVAVIAVVLVVIARTS
ncbi:MAG TPA: NADH-quinone oxidoreductase subunit L [Dehalococcoidia bacterium]|nr:NADH-quinone oxidoreductase subunit L [Dehalococcoidia bacterium]